ncbi:MAG TPA: adenine phosphoribosyltransferase [Chloroflexota bacterium]|nr:adenine phosphoribosyltransferase [Chloroflexota bacterium]
MPEYNTPFLEVGLADAVEEIRRLIREVPDFPQPGVLFYDVTTVLKDAAAFRRSIDVMAEPWRSVQVDAIAAMESRGFIFGAPLAYLLNAGFIPIRKLGKLPAPTVSREYSLEYGSNVLEIHRDAVEPGQRVLLVDDVLATGGTIATSVEIVRELGAIPIGIVVLIELDFLKGQDRLGEYGIEVTSFVHY